MLFSSTLFLFLFLPGVLAVYYCAPRKARNAILLTANLIFYGWGEPVYVGVMAASILANYILGLCIEKHRPTPGRAKLFLTVAVAVNLGLLGFFKYTNFFARLFTALLPASMLSVPHILLPIGISFYTFQSMSYCIDVYRGDTAAQRNLIHFGTYVSLFPQLIAGPIVRYKDVAEQLDGRVENLPQFSDGVKLFLVGVTKKVLLANQMGILWEAMKAAPGENGILGSWIGILAFGFQIYFDFSGYSDMARGLGKMFGFEFMVNFNYPYISKSITEFWRRWHISLSTWFRDYVYIPMGGSRRGTARTVFNLFVVWSLTGFWHGADYNFILWGVYYFGILSLEKFLFSPYLNKAPTLLAHGYTLVLVMLGWVLFSCDNLAQMTDYLASLFTLHHGVLGPDAAFYARMYLPLLLVCGLACCPAAKWLYGRLAEKRGGWVLEAGLICAALALCTAALVSQSYNPFLYFRF